MDRLGESQQYGSYNNLKTLELFSEWKNNKSIKNSVLKGNF